MHKKVPSELAVKTTNPPSHTLAFHNPKAHSRCWGEKPKGLRMGEGPEGTPALLWGSRLGMTARAAGACRWIMDRSPSDAGHGAGKTNSKKKRNRELLLSSMAGGQSQHGYKIELKFFDLNLNIEDYKNTNDTFKFKLKFEMYFFPEYSWGSFRGGSLSQARIAADEDRTPPGVVVGWCRLIKILTGKGVRANRQNSFG